MNLFTELDRQLQRTLDGIPDEADLLPMMGFESKSRGEESLVQRLQDLADDAMDVDDEEQSGKERIIQDPFDRRLKRKR
jgi:hypothetical protein